MAGAVEWQQWRGCRVPKGFQIPSALCEDLPLPLPTSSLHPPHFFPINGKLGRKLVRAYVVVIVTAGCIVSIKQKHVNVECPVEEFLNGKGLPPTYVGPEIEVSLAEIGVINQIHPRGNVSDGVITNGTKKACRVESHKRKRSNPA